MDNNPLVSIIIPVYNGAATIRRAVDSVLNNSFKDIEIIIIDDGSKDDTVGVVNTYYKSEEKVHLISKKNAGVSAARNDGLKQVRAPYFMTLDSDDYMDPDMIAKLYEAITDNDSDIAICGFRNVFAEGGRENFASTYAYNGEKKDFLDTIFTELYDKHLISTHANKLYKLSIVQERRIEYNTFLSVNEDIDFVLRYLRECKTISVIKGVYLNYVQHDINESLINTFRDYGVASALLILRRMNGLFEGEAVTEETINEVNNRIFTHICSFVGLMYYADDYTDNMRMAILNKLINFDEFNDLLSDIRADDLKSAVAVVLLREGKIGLYNKICKLMYNTKHSLFKTIIDRVGKKDDSSNAEAEKTVKNINNKSAARELTRAEDRFVDDGFLSLLGVGDNIDIKGSSTVTLEDLKKVRELREKKKENGGK